MLKICSHVGTLGTHAASIIIRAFDFSAMKHAEVRYEFVNQCLEMWFIFHKIVPL
jgi:hypothetical protein